MCTLAELFGNVLRNYIIALSLETNELSQKLTRIQRTNPSFAINKILSLIFVLCSDYSSNHNQNIQNNFANIAISIITDLYKKIPIEIWYGLQVIKFEILTNRIQFICGIFVELICIIINQLTYMFI